ncbi:MarR family transcriptional regulator [Mycolicibacterium sp. P1-18]|uniref:MarR family winged helix-turn-helix transcriptional regulator n=1 Tax=Mycolicibacterium sp. P1-18 TaxID=2024615 RepID=UPI0011F1A52C|nr:MarR family transcriptional regulator [Mycolicibacterium sp. P1-18]KAA0094698.1 MarR family transcriptional regulator [Mycolicibacterium sp. P1-18]
MSSRVATDTTLSADLLSVVARLNRLATQRVKLELPYAQARLLSTIEDQGAARISDLAAFDHCSQPTMTTQVRRLEEAALVSRVTDPADARAVLISITEKGRQVLARVRADRSAVVDPYLERLDPADRQSLTEAVRVMRAILADAAQSAESGSPTTTSRP